MATLLPCTDDFSCLQPSSPNELKKGLFKGTGLPTPVATKPLYNEIELFKSGLHRTKINAKNDVIEIKISKDINKYHL